jgi:gas vesicle protein
MLGSWSAGSMLGLGLGLLAGAAAGLLWAPMQGRQLRESLRSRAEGAFDRGLRLIDEGRRALQTSSATPGPLTATMGEIAEMHTGTPLPSEARS